MDEKTKVKLKKDCKQIFGVGFIFRGDSAFEIEENIIQYLSNLPMEAVKNYRSEIKFATLQNAHFKRADQLIAIFISTVALFVSGIAVFNVNFGAVSSLLGLVCIFLLYAVVMAYVSKATMQMDHDPNYQFILNCINEYINSQP